MASLELGGGVLRHRKCAGKCAGKKGGKRTEEDGEAVIDADLVS